MSYLYTLHKVKPCAILHMVKPCAILHRVQHCTWWNRVHKVKLCATLHKVKPLHKVKVKPCAIAQGEAHKVKLTRWSYCTRWSTQGEAIAQGERGTDGPCNEITRSVIVTYHFPLQLYLYPNVLNVASLHCHILHRRRSWSGWSGFGRTMHFLADLMKFIVGLPAYPVC